MINLKQILYASNLDKTCAETLQHVMEIAQFTDAKVTVLHVVKPMLAAYTSPDLFESYDLEGTLTRDAKKKLLKFTQEVNFPSDQTIVSNGHPASTILKYADKLNMNLIVLNGHNHNVFGRLGSTADAVMNRAKCDVLIMRNPKE